VSTKNLVLLQVRVSLLDTNQSSTCMSPFTASCSERKQFDFDCVFWLASRQHFRL